MKIHHIHQTTAKNCGQAVCAMLSGVTIQQVSRKMRRSGDTEKSDLVEYLKTTGLACGPTLRLSAFKTLRHFGDVLPDCSVLRVRKSKRCNFHWVIYFGGLVFDPWLYGPESSEAFIEMCKALELYVTSVFEVSDAA